MAAESLSHKIRLTLWNEDEQPVIVKTFEGRWLVGDAEEGLRADDASHNWDAGAEWSVAETARGRLVVYLTHCNDGFAPSMTVYEGFGALKDAKDEHGTVLPQNVVAETAAALGVPYETELDI